MTIEKTPFKNLLLITPRIFEDERGYFYESFNEALFRIETGLNITFVQDNESKSAKGVLRGLHYQLPPKTQAKLIRVVKGAVLDVVVDLRRTEPTYGQHYKVLLSEQNKLQFFVPEGFAHGFVALEENTIFSYKCSNYYSKDHDRSLLWNDADLSIDWGIANPLVSEKDQKAGRFAEVPEVFF